MRYLLSPHTSVFAIEYERHVVGTCSVFDGNTAHMPLEKTFADVVRRSRKKERRVAEVGRFVVDNGLLFTHRRVLRDPLLIYGLFMNLGRFFTERKFDMIYVVLHETNQFKAYNKIGFKSLGRARPYAMLNNTLFTPFVLDMKETGMLGKYLLRKSTSV